MARGVIQICFRISFPLVTVQQALASLTKLLEENNISIVVQEFLGESKEEDHESPIEMLKVETKYEGF